MSYRDGYCQHGVYVGGCGPDYMCGYCEMGMDQYYFHTYYKALIVVPNEKKGGYSSIESSQFYTRDEAEEWCDSWHLVEATGLVVALYIYPVEGGYWAERDRENERFIEVWDSHTQKSYEVAYLHDKEIEYIRKEVERINESLDEERFFITNHSVAFHSVEIVRFLDWLVEQDDDDND